MKSYKYRCLGIVLLAASLSGCMLGVGPYKSENTLRESFECDSITDSDVERSYLNQCKIDASEEGDNQRRSVFGVVEFDDFGEFLNADQASELLDVIRESAEERPTFLSVFIHGWRHNASEGSSNLKDYRELVRRLGEVECSKLFLTREKNCVKPNVIGVYVSWRGDPLGLTNDKLTKDSKLRAVIKTPQYLSFWNRWKASQRISNTNMTHFLLQLAEKVDQGDKKRLKREKIRSCILADYLGGAQQCSRKLVIGHSFGGRILEHTMAQAFIGNRNLANKMDLQELINQQSSRLDALSNNIRNIKQTRKKLATAKKKNEENVKDLEDQLTSVDETRKKTKKTADDLDREINAIPEARSYYDDFRRLTNAFGEDIVGVAENTTRSLCTVLVRLSGKYTLGGAFAAEYQLAQCEEKVSNDDNSLAQVPDSACSSKEDNCPSDTKQVDRKTLTVSEIDQSKIAVQLCRVWRNFTKLKNELGRQVQHGGTDKLFDCDEEDSRKELEDFATMAATAVESHDRAKADLRENNFATVSSYYDSLKRFASGLSESFEGLDKTLPKSIQIPEDGMKTLKRLRENLNSKHEFTVKTKDTNSIVLSKRISGHIKSFLTASKDIEVLEKQLRAERSKLEIERDKVELLEKAISASEELVKEIVEREAELTKIGREDGKALIDMAKGLEKLTYSVYEPPYNLALLLNPANEAIHTNMLKGAMCDAKEYIEARKHFGIKDRPWLVAMSSKQDQATGRLFKSATAVSVLKRVFDPRPVKSSRPPLFGDSCTSTASQRELAMAPAPFVEDLLTHEIKDVGADDAKCLDEFSIGNRPRLEMEHGISRGLSFVQSVESNPSCDWHLGDYQLTNKEGEVVGERSLLLCECEKKSKEDDKGCECTNRSKINQSNSQDAHDLWVMQVDPHLIKDHNDIFNPSVGKLIAVMFRRNLSIGSSCRVDELRGQVLSSLQEGSDQNPRNICSIVGKTQNMIRGLSSLAWN